MESIAPTELAQDWDNVGLLAGDPSMPVRRVLLCIDLTAAVVDEAAGSKIDLVLAYHPPIFKPVSTLRADSPGPEAAIFQCIARGIAVYATHTALDAADGGTNDVLAALCGIKTTEPVEYVDEPTASEHKLVVFVPPQEVGQVGEAMFAAGAGQIGGYSRCSYRLGGQGTFFGGETTTPTIGEKGRMEFVDEVRLETVVPSNVLPQVVRAMIRAHSYEEPAFDIYPLRPKPVRGIGRVGMLPRTMTLSGLARKLKPATGAVDVRIVGAPNDKIDRAIIVVGAAGSIPFSAVRTFAQAEPRRLAGDVIVTGEIRHHDALTIRRLGCAAIALGHWASERPVLPSLSRRLESTAPGVAVTVSTIDTDPFRRL